MKKICFIFGTRPEIIKTAPVIKECMNRNIPFFIIHTGQHYSPNMDDVFIKGLKLPDINFNLRVGSGSHATQTAAMMIGIESILTNERPDWVVVQGDTNSVLAGAVTASKLNIPVAHLEAGLRSYDRKMPEEINRVITGSVASVHFAPTKIAVNNLLVEGFDKKIVYMVGNSIVDSVIQNLALSEAQSTILETEKLKNDSFVLVTIHRPENTDNIKNMEIIVESLISLSKSTDLQIIWPIHPRTHSKIKEYGLDDQILNHKRVRIIEPVDFFDMLQLQKNAEVIVTDSGGIQEESCILGTPCITVRNNTERPESVEVGANILTGCNKNSILSAAQRFLSEEKKTWVNPFGDGTTSKQVVDVLTK